MFFWVERVVRENFLKFFCHQLPLHIVTIQKILSYKQIIHICKFSSNYWFKAILIVKQKTSLTYCADVDVALLAKILVEFQS